jgi:general secretion pathway protein L
MQGNALPLRPIADGVARFLGWWRDELWGLVPEYGRRLMTGARSDVVLAEVDGRYLVLAETASRGPAAAPGPRVLPRAQAISQLVEAAQKAALATGLRIPADRCYVRRVELPKAALADARRILNLDLERVTPFRLKDVYTAHVVDNEGANGKCWVRQFVIKREAVDPIITDVKAAGGDVAFVDCWDEEPSKGLPVDFLEPNVSAGQSRVGRLFTVTRALAACAAGLIVTAVLLTITRQETALAELQVQTAKVRERAASVRQVLDRADTTIGNLAQLQQMKLTRIPTLAVLEELSRLLPDTVWLSEFRLEGDMLDISGLAKSGAALPPLFAQSAIFADAALTAPLTLDAREDKERFSLRVRVKSPAGSQQTAEKDAKE